MEYEAKDTLKLLLPWYRNAEQQQNGEENYDELLRKHNFLNTWSVEEIITFVQDVESSNTDNAPIRRKRKLAAELLLGPHVVHRHVHLLRHWLKQLLPEEDVNKNCCNKHANTKDEQNVAALVQEALDEAVKEKPRLEEHRETITEYFENNADIDGDRIRGLTSRELITSLVEFGGNKQIRGVVRKFHEKLMAKFRILSDDEKLLAQIEEVVASHSTCYQSGNSDCLDITEDGLPVFRSIMRLKFEAVDPLKLEKIQKFGGNDCVWYRHYIAGWREIPQWYVPQSNSDDMFDETKSILSSLHNTFYTVSTSKVYLRA